MSIQNQRLTTIRLKTQRAKEHITTLQNTIQTFFQSKPYQVSTKKDNASRLVYYLSSVHDTPLYLSLIAGDVIQNLSSSLDHLAWQLYLIGAGTSYKDERIYFPITNDSTFYKKCVSKLGVMRNDAIQVLNSIQPYKNGTEHNLWLLHKLNNIDKHRLLVTVGSAFQSLNLGAYQLAELEKAMGKKLPKLDFYVKPQDNLFPLKEGSELFIDVPNAEPSPVLDFSFNIVFNELGIVERKPVIETMNDLYSEVEKTIQKFEPCLT